MLGSSWSGVGAGLLSLPGYWGGFVPWEMNRADAQARGVWASALGVGVLGILAEDDLAPQPCRDPLGARRCGGRRAGAGGRWRRGALVVRSRPGARAMLLGLLIAGASGLWLSRDRRTAPVTGRAVWTVWAG
ncbi:hypothetical protein [Streptomyces abyssomicinicus]|uniref:hypothetical protein n=1 Tax=Streptomyces abyssomicinicus TaxID=574929 RepID=UPI0012504EDC|nr:hypothetical protein [Streptomyces abyssomicinicus]